MKQNKNYKKFSLFRDKYSEFSRDNISYKGQGRGSYFKTQAKVWKKLKELDTNAITYAFSENFTDYFTINKQGVVIEKDDFIKDAKIIIDNIKTPLHWWYLKTEFYELLNNLIGFENLSIKFTDLSGISVVYEDYKSISSLYELFKKIDSSSRESMKFKDDYIEFDNFDISKDERGKLQITSTFNNTYNNLKRVTEEGDNEYKDNRDSKIEGDQQIDKRQAEDKDKDKAEIIDKDIEIERLKTEQEKLKAETERQKTLQKALDLYSIGKISEEQFNKIIGL